MQKVLIELRAVTRVYSGEDAEEAVGVTALDDVSLQIGSGEFICITGPSGSGKSTLMNIIGCLDRPTQGEYRFAGAEVFQLDDDGLAALRRDELGFVFQAYNLLESLTALGNVELPATYTTAEPKDSRDRAEELLHTFGMQERRNHRPGQLSGGEQQRVAIARSLMNGARVILCDEPTGALDTAQGDEVLALLEDLATQGHTVIIISHNKEVAARAHRIVELYDGRVVSDSASLTAMNATLEPPQALVGGMPWLSVLRSGFGALRTGGLRTALVIFTVALGILSVVALLGLVEGANREANSILERMGANRLSVGGMEMVDPSIWLRRSLPRTLEDAQAIRQQIANVQSVVPSMVEQLPVRAGSKQLDDLFVRAMLEPEARTQVQNLPWPVDHGTFLTPRDSDELARVAVIGPKLRDQLFGPGVDAVGEHIEIKGLQFLVKGVLTPHPRLYGEGEYFVTDRESASSELPYYSFAEGLDVFIPFRTGAELLFSSENLTRLDVFVADLSRSDETAAEIRDLMFRHHGHAGYTVENNAQAFAANRALSETQAGIFATLGGLALLVAGLSIMAIMLAGVSQRRREIGIRMAVGARRRDISVQFLVEAALLTTFGGAGGTLLAFASSPLLSQLSGAPVAMAPWFLPVALGCAVMTGLLFGTLPARRGARLDPVHALAED